MLRVLKQWAAFVALLACLAVCVVLFAAEHPVWGSVAIIVLSWLRPAPGDVAELRRAQYEIRPVARAYAQREIITDVYRFELARAMAMRLPETHREFAELSSAFTDPDADWRLTD